MIKNFLEFYCFGSSWNPLSLLHHLLNPMVVIGLLIGCLICLFLDGGDIFFFCFTPLFYLIAFSISAFYFICFRRIYLSDRKTDWSSTLWAAFKGAFTLIFANFFVVLIGTFFSVEICGAFKIFLLAIFAAFF